jgi:hypothetical protein
MQEEWTLLPWLTHAGMVYVLEKVEPLYNPWNHLQCLRDLPDTILLGILRPALISLPVLVIKNYTPLLVYPEPKRPSYPDRR